MGRTSLDTIPHEAHSRDFEAVKTKYLEKKAAQAAAAAAAKK